jgi:Tfp pilus assembly protein PilO
MRNGHVKNIGNWTERMSIIIVVVVVVVVALFFFCVCVAIKIYLCCIILRILNFSAFFIL